jgi:hypothetical protein
LRTAARRGIKGPETAVVMLLDESD